MPGSNARTGEYDDCRRDVRQADRAPPNLRYAAQCPDPGPGQGARVFHQGEDLAEFRTTPAAWASLNDSTVSFVIPDGEIIDEVPSFLRTPEVEPSVLIRYQRGPSSPSSRSRNLNGAQPLYVSEGHVF